MMMTVRMTIIIIIIIAMPALQKACSAVWVKGAASFVVILRIYLETVNAGLLRS